ncbi:MAG: trimeric intracellular cation channel family protein [Candidatus Limnocylindria bacterium]
MQSLLTVLDLAGTFVFALSGALVGVRHRLDLFGVLVLAFAAATAGGVIRDLIIGAVPPPAIADPRYFVVPVIAGLLTFVWHPVVTRLQASVLVLDGAGLALFAVSGAIKALDFGLGPVAAVLLGGLTGIGGGVVRDVLVSEVPTVFRAELYAVAALAGASVVVAGGAVGLPAPAVAIGGALVCFGLRMIGVRRGWKLPTPRL